LSDALEFDITVVLKLGRLTRNDAGDPGRKKNRIEMLASTM
jgi:hypothetical protein